MRYDGKRPTGSADGQRKRQRRPTLSEDASLTPDGQLRMAGRFASGLGSTRGRSIAKRYLLRLLIGIAVLAAILTAVYNFFGN